MSTTNEREAPCGECGMICRPSEFHPYAACLMFKGCHDGETVRANLAALAPAHQPTGACAHEYPRSKTEALERLRHCWEHYRMSQETAQAIEAVLAVAPAQPVAPHPRCPWDEWKAARETSHGIEGPKG